jgi:hypothetical protein
MRRLIVILLLLPLTLFSQSGILGVLYTGGTEPGGGPVEGLQNIIFTRSATNNIYLTHTGLWTPINATTDWSNTGMDTRYKIAAGQSGWIQFQRTAYNHNAYIGFTDSFAEVDRSAMKAAIGYDAGGGNLYVAESGTFTPKGVVSENHYVRLYRDGTTGTITVETSPDGSTWTGRHTCTYSTTGDLFLVISINGGGGSYAHYVKGYGLSRVQTVKPDLWMEGFNPNYPSWGEVSMMMQEGGETAEVFYRLVNTPSVNYRTLSGPLMDQLGPVTTLNLGMNAYFPTVQKYGGTYYMTVTDAFPGNTYLYASTDKINWTKLNGGSPIITQSPDPTHWSARLWNSGFCIVNDTIHLLIEGAALSGAYSTKAWIGYASAPVSSPQMTLAATPITPGGNPDLHYVAERNAIVATWSPVVPTYEVEGGLGRWELRFGSVDLDTDLTNAANWHVSDLRFKYLGDDIADAAFMLTPGKTYPAMLYFNYGQNTGYMSYVPGITSLAELYDAIQ